MKVVTIVYKDKKTGKTGEISYKLEGGIKYKDIKKALRKSGVKVQNIFLTYHGD